MIRKGKLKQSEKRPTPMPLRLLQDLHSLIRQAYCSHACMIRSHWLNCMEHSFFISRCSCSWSIHSLTFREP